MQGRRTQRPNALGMLVVALGAAFAVAVPSAGVASGSPDPAPVVSAVSPSTGFASTEQAPEPQTPVTITGANFDGATVVGFGQVDTGDFKVVSSTEIVVNTPQPSSAGTVDMTVTTPAGTSATSAADRFTFTAPPVPTDPPVVTSVTPSTVSDGVETTVNGSNFLYVTSVQVGSTSSPFLVTSPTTLVIQNVPSEPPGTVLDVTVTGPAGTSAATSADRITYVAAPPQPPTAGYWEVAADGGIFTFGNAGFFGSMGGVHLNAPVVGMAVHLVNENVDGGAGGYWEVAADGGIFSFGNAPFYGSMGRTHLNAPVVGMALDPVTGGYWEVASDGGIFSFNAPFHGSASGMSPNSRIVGMAATPDGGGYWLAAANGAVFAFGDAGTFGSATNSLATPVVGITATVTGGGYWLVTNNGAIFAVGDAPNHGSTAGFPLNKPIVGMASTYNAGFSAGDGTYGYWEAASDGGIFTFGNTAFYGSMGGTHLNAPIVGVTATPQPTMLSTPD
jgi:hypothetical protein